MFRNCASQPHETFPKGTELSETGPFLLARFCEADWLNSETKKLPACRPPFPCLTDGINGSSLCLLFSLWYQPGQDMILVLLYGQSIYQDLSRAPCFVHHVNCVFPPLRDNLALAATPHNNEPSTSPSTPTECYIPLLSRLKHLGTMLTSWASSRHHTHSAFPIQSPQLVRLPQSSSP